jgi:hypothetical protein
LAVRIRIDDALKHVRTKLGCADADSLVICVDEVIDLGDVEAEKMLSQLMKTQDSWKGKVIFLFTSSLVTHHCSCRWKPVQPDSVVVDHLAGVFFRD